MDKKKAFPFLGLAVAVMAVFLVISIRDRESNDLTPRVESPEVVDHQVEDSQKNIIEALLTEAQRNSNYAIKIIKADENHIRADIFFGPGGAYILAAKSEGKWVKAAEGNGIPACNLIDSYNFSQEIVPSCLAENGSLKLRDWEAVKSLIRDCEVKSVMQSHSLEVALEMKNGDKMQAVEPVIDEVIDLAQEASGKCGRIIMATE